jgi:hypothetical protein
LGAGKLRVKNRFNFVSSCFKFVEEVVEGLVLMTEKMKRTGKWLEISAFERDA